MRSTLTTVLLTLFTLTNYANVCDSINSVIKKKNTLSFVNEVIKQSKNNNDTITYLCAYKRKPKYQCNLNNNQCKIEIVQTLLKDSFFRSPKTYIEKILHVRIYVDLANSFRKNSSSGGAKENYKVADSLFRAYKIVSKDYNIGNYCLKRLGVIYTQEGDYEKAIYTFKRAEQQLLRHKAKPDNFASLYFNWGRVYNDLEEYGNELDLYKKGLAIKGLSKIYTAKMSFAILEGEFVNYLSKKEADTSVKFKKTDLYNAREALDQLQSLTKIFKDRISSDPVGANNFLNGIYGLKAEIEQEFALLSKDEIIAFHLKALNAVKEYKSNTPNAREIAKEYYVIGQTYLNFSETDSAKHYFYLGIQTILPKFNSKQNALPKKDLFFNENAIFENLEGLAEVFTIQDSLELALQAYELAFYVKLKLRSIYDFESSKLYLQQKAKAINSKAIKIAWQLHKKTNEEQYIKRAFKIAESSRALVLLEGIAKNEILKQNENVDSAFATQKARFDEPISINKLHKVLVEDEVLLEYFQTDSLLYAFKIQKNKAPEFYQLKPDFEQINQLLELLRYSSDYKAYTSAAHNVYRNIIEPLQIPANKKLIIVPDGKLSELPFAALINNLPAGNKAFKKLPYLIKEHSIAYQYSATIYSKLNQQLNNAARHEVLAIAPVFEDTKSALPYSLDEITEIGRYFNTIPLTQKAAASNNIIDRLAHFNVLHFSTHATAGDGFENPPKIELYNSELWLNDIYSQALNANLTVLSACETNIGKYESGEGVMSLSRAFAYAGCPSLVSTLWQVNDASTKEIVVGFYKNLKEGLGKDKALQTAKLNYLQNADDAHPYYWASLVAIGNMQPLAPSQQFPFSKYVWLLFPLGIAVALLLTWQLNNWIFLEAKR